MQKKVARKMQQKLPDYKNAKKLPNYKNAKIVAKL